MRKNKRKLSIIIPTKNEEKYLPLLLKKLKKQSFQDFEIIVADNDSKDKTVKIAKKFGCKIVKGGLPAIGRNNGANFAKGEILLFLDADNIYIENDFLEKALREFKRRNLGVAGFFVFPKEGFIDLFLYSFFYIFAFLTQWFLPHASNAILVKKEIFKKVGGFNEEVLMGEDHYFVRKASKFGKFGILNISIITSLRKRKKIGFLKMYFSYLLGGFFLFFIEKLPSLKKLQKKFFLNYFS